MSTYLATVKWQRSGAAFRDGQYSRAHVWCFDGGAEVPASPSPHIVPPPFSVEENVDPEEAFVAAVSSCHMLFFLEIAYKNKFTVDRYEDEAIGEMSADEKGHEYIRRVMLRPAIAFSGPKFPSEEKLSKMHHRAHELCYIANSIRSEVITKITPPITDLSSVSAGG